MFNKNKKASAPSDDHREARNYYRQDDYYGEDYDRSSRESYNEDVRRSSQLQERRSSRAEYARRDAYGYDSRAGYDGGRRDTDRYDDRGRAGNLAADRYDAPRGRSSRRENRYDDRRDERGRYRSGYDERGRDMYDDRRRGYPRRKKRHTGRNILIVILILLALLAGGAWMYLGQINHEKLTGLITNTGITQTGYRNIVIYGVDSRDGKMTSETHSDSIMICSINKKTKEVRLVSVYRDTYLDNTNGEYRKATECYYFGGPERSISMLNKNLDLDIADYVTVDFSSVIQIVDAVGGIDLEITDEEMELINGYCVENKAVTGVDYTPLTSSGYVHLEGIQALAYCRIRYTEGWDYKRTERQRTVMSLTYQKALQKGIPAVISIANSVLPNISTSMSTVDIISLVSGMASYSVGEQAGFPFDKATADLSDAGDVVVPVTLSSNVSQLHAFLFDETSYTPSDAVQEISAVIAERTGYYG